MPAAAPQKVTVPISLEAACHVSEEGVERLAFDQAQQLLRALAEPIRLRVLEALGGGERCVCDLTTELKLPQPKLSFHLKVMKEAGLITARQQGRWMYYRLQPDVLLNLRDWLGAVVARSDQPARQCS